MLLNIAYKYNMDVIVGVVVGCNKLFLPGKPMEHIILEAISVHVDGKKVIRSSKQIYKR